MDKPVFFRYDNDSGILYRICKYNPLAELI